jgi:hypothetical protein
MPLLSGFTLVRNAVALDYPIVPAIRSMLEVCDEVVVNVGRSEDGTRDLVTAIGDPRVRILDTEWDFSRGSEGLARETNRAMAACRGTWGLYVQADEVLHESGAALLAQKAREWDDDRRVEGLLVDYLHFYGDFHTLATNRHWYRREVRVVRLGRGGGGGDHDIRSFQDAQGFRVGPERRRVRARATGATMFHYGWARTPHSVHRKLAASREIYTDAPAVHERRAQRPPLEWTPLLRRFTGSHPRAAAEWIAAHGEVQAEAIRPRPFKLDDLRFYLSDWIERSTGVRLFEYRNYVLV